MRYTRQENQVHNTDARTILLLLFFAAISDVPAAAYGGTASIGSATGANDSTVTVQISLADAEEITGVSPTITYDPSVVQVQGMTANTTVVAMTSQGSPNIDNTAGRARMTMTASLPGITVADAAPIADVTLHLVGGDGTSTDLRFVDTA